MMNPVTSTPGIGIVYSANVTPAVSIRQVAASNDSAATQVSLGQDTRVADAETYSSRGTLGAPTGRYVWEKDSLDKLSLQMLSAVSGNAARFQGLGAALLEQLAANGGQGISQSALWVDETRSSAPGALELQRNHLREQASDRVTLSLTTASGATISLGLYSGEQGLAVQASVDGGELNDAELKALASLADGFQKAVDGLAKQPPSLQLEGLLGFDQQLFGSLQLSATFAQADGVQQFDLRLDQDTRSLSLQGPSGEVKMNFDTQGGKLLGSSAQREAALSSYLEQFEAARQRGKGDEQLNALFKDAFTQLNRVDDTSSRPAEHNLALNTVSRALLSGLADFKASITEKVERPNPLRPNEVEQFEYQVSQATRKTSSGHRTSLQQDQTSSLTAAWHSPLDPRTELRLSREAKSQSYRYHEVSDQAQSSTRLGIADGSLIEASTTRQASSSERVREYQEGVLTVDDTTRNAQRQSQELLKLLDSLLEDDRAAKRNGLASTLDTRLANNSRLWLLQSDPAQL